MSGNRVEELEARVRELQATIDGLTDELLETKERLRIVEEEVDPALDMDIIEGRPAATPETQTNDTGGKSARGDGGAGPTSEADGAKGGESEEGDTDSADDIIVA